MSAVGVAARSAKHRPVTTWWWLLPSLPLSNRLPPPHLLLLRLPSQDADVPDVEDADAEAFARTNIKMGKTGDVVAIVKAGDKNYTAKKAVKVTIGGCGG